MRVSPIAEYYNYNSMLRVVYKGTEITHNTAEAIFLAEMVAELIYLGKKGWNLKEAIDKVKEKYSDFLYNFNSKESVELARNTIPLVLQTLEEAENFEDVIRIAVSFGGDTDTVACVAGSIAEFYYLIPEEMIKKAKTYLPKEMINVIEKFYLQF